MCGVSAALKVLHNIPNSCLGVSIGGAGRGQVCANPLWALSMCLPKGSSCRTQNRPCGFGKSLGAAVKLLLNGAPGVGPEGSATTKCQILGMGRGGKKMQSFQPKKSLLLSPSNIMEQVYVQVHDPTSSQRKPHVPEQPRILPLGSSNSSCSWGSSLGCLFVIKLDFTGMSAAHPLYPVAGLHCEVPPSLHKQEKIPGAGNSSVWDSKAKQPLVVPSQPWRRKTWSVRGSSPGSPQCCIPEGWARAGDLLSPAQQIPQNLFGRGREMHRRSRCSCNASDPHGSFANRSCTEFPAH